MLRFLGMRSRAGFVRYLDGFDVPLAHQGIVLVSAENRDIAGMDSNGAGKTTLLADALSWGFFAKMFRYGNERLAARDVCVEGRTAHVEIDFETTHGTFRTSRTQRPTGSPVLTIHTPGPDADAWPLLPDQATHARDATDRLTSLLGFDYLTMRSALVLQGATFAGNTYAEDMKVLESVLRFDAFTAGKKVSTVKRDEIDRAIQSTLDEMQRQLNALEISRSTLAQLEALDESDRERELVGVVQAHKRALKSLSTARVDFDTCVTRLRQAEATELGARTELAHARKHLETVAAIGARCVYCRATLTARQRGALTRDAKQLVEVWTTKHQDARDRMTVAQDDEATATDRYRTWEDRTRDELVARAELMAIRERRDKRLDVIRLHADIIADAETRLADLTDRVAAARHERGIADQWVRRDWDGLKAATFREGAPILNAAAQRYSDHFTDGQIRVSFPMSKQDDGSIMRIDGASAPTYKGCSAGEKRCIDIIRALSLRDLARWRMNGPTNIAVWDEVLDPLDALGVERALVILQQDMDECESVFVVTHSETVRALFPGARTWRVIREHGVSRVETT